ncbi:hypothetical protein GGR64_000766 [Xanthomonas arboricola]|nr:hypothetical protein [Xanthomonas sp. 3307]
MTNLSITMGEKNPAANEIIFEARPSMALTGKNI